MEERLRKQLSDLTERAHRVIQGESSPSLPNASLDLPNPSLLTRLLSLTQSMNRQRSSADLLQYIQDRLRELFEAENSQVILIGVDGEPTLPQDPPGSAGVANGQTRLPEFSRTLIDRVCQQRRPLLIRDTSEDAELREQSSVSRLGLVSVLCAPLIVDDRVIGVIQFDHRNRPSPFSEADLTLLGLFANQAATALHNLTLAEEKERMLRQLEESHEQQVAGERLRALGQMAAGVAHHFNNLLTSILGYCDLLDRTQTYPAEHRRDLEILRASARDGAATVARLQEFAGGATADRNYGPVELSEIVKEVAEFCSHRTSGGALSITTRLEPDCFVLGHVAELRDVITNLTVNALDSMPQGGVAQLQTYKENNQVVFEVLDEGIGIPNAARQRIFEPFFTTKATGTGLGLSICWGVVQRLGGKIEAMPGPEKGTRFILTLPATVLTGEAPRHAGAPAHQQGRRARVLLVDDDDHVRHMLSRVLQSAGHEVTPLKSATAALAAWQGPYDAVLTDYGMPQMNGLEFAREVQNVAPGTPVIVLTGWSPSGSDFSELVEGVAQVLPKPLNMEALLETLDRLLASPLDPRGGSSSEVD